MRRGGADERVVGAAVRDAGLRGRPAGSTPSVTIRYDSLPAVRIFLSTFFAIWSPGFNYNATSFRTGIGSCRVYH